MSLMFDSDSSNGSGDDLVFVGSQGLVREKNEKSKAKKPPRICVSQLTRTSALRSKDCSSKKFNESPVLKRIDELNSSITIDDSEEDFDGANKDIQNSLTSRSLASQNIKNIIRRGNQTQSSVQSSLDANHLASTSTPVHQRTQRHANRQSNVRWSQKPVLSLRQDTRSKGRQPGKSQQQKTFAKMACSSDRDDLSSSSSDLESTPYQKTSLSCQSSIVNSSSRSVSKSTTNLDRKSRIDQTAKKGVGGSGVDRKKISGSDDQAIQKKKNFKSKRLSAPSDLSVNTSEKDSHRSTRKDNHYSADESSNDSIPWLTTQTDRPTSLENDAAPETGHNDKDVISESDMESDLECIFEPKLNPKQSQRSEKQWQESKHTKELGHEQSSQLSLCSKYFATNKLSRAQETVRRRKNMQSESLSCEPSLSQKPTLSLKSPNRNLSTSSKKKTTQSEMLSSSKSQFKFDSVLAEKNSTPYLKQRKSVSNSGTVSPVLKTSNDVAGDAETSQKLDRISNIQSQKAIIKPEESRVSPWLFPSRNKNFQRRIGESTQELDECDFISDSDEESNSRTWLQSQRSSRLSLGSNKKKEKQRNHGESSRRASHNSVGLSHKTKVNSLSVSNSQKGLEKDSQTLSGISSTDVSVAKKPKLSLRSGFSGKPRNVLGTSQNTSKEMVKNESDDDKCSHLSHQKDSKHNPEIQKYSDILQGHIKKEAREKLSFLIKGAKERCSVQSTSSHAAPGSTEDNCIDIDDEDLNDDNDRKSLDKKSHVDKKESKAEQTISKRSNQLCNEESQKTIVPSKEDNDTDQCLDTQETVILSENEIQNMSEKRQSFTTNSSTPRKKNCSVSSERLSLESDRTIEYALSGFSGKANDNVIPSSISPIEHESSPENEGHLPCLRKNSSSDPCSEIISPQDKRMDPSDVGTCADKSGISPSMPVLSICLSIPSRNSSFDENSNNTLPELSFYKKDSLSYLTSGCDENCTSQNGETLQIKREKTLAVQNVRTVGPFVHKSDDSPPPLTPQRNDTLLSLPHEKEEKRGKDLSIEKEATLLPVMLEADETLPPLIPKPDIPPRFTHKKNRKDESVTIQKVETLPPPLLTTEILSPWMPAKDDIQQNDACPSIMNKKGDATLPSASLKEKIRREEIKSCDDDRKEIGLTSSNYVKGISLPSRLNRESLVPQETKRSVNTKKGEGVGDVEKDQDDKDKGTLQPPEETEMFTQDSFSPCYSLRDNIEQVVGNLEQTGSQLQIHVQTLNPEEFVMVKSEPNETHADNISGPQTAAEKDANGDKVEQDNSSFYEEEDGLVYVYGSDDEEVFNTQSIFSADLEGGEKAYSSEDDETAEEDYRKSQDNSLWWDNSDDDDILFENCDDYEMDFALPSTSSESSVVVEKHDSEEKEIDSEEKEIDSEEKEIDSKEKEIDSKEKEIDSEAKEIDFKVKKIDSEEKEIDSDEKEIDSQAKEIIDSEAKTIDCEVTDIPENVEYNENEVYKAAEFEIPSDSNDDCSDGEEPEYTLETREFPESLLRMTDEELFPDEFPKAKALETTTKTKPPETSKTKTPETTKTKTLETPETKTSETSKTKTPETGKTNYPETSKTKTKKIETISKKSVSFDQTVNKVIVLSGNEEVSSNFEKMPSNEPINNVDSCVMDDMDEGSLSDCNGQDNLYDLATQVVDVPEEKGGNDSPFGEDDYLANTQVDDFIISSDEVEDVAEQNASPGRGENYSENTSGNGLRAVKTQKSQFIEEELTSASKSHGKDNLKGLEVIDEGGEENDENINKVNDVYAMQTQVDMDYDEKDETESDGLFTMQTLVDDYEPDYGSGDDCQHHEENHDDDKATQRKERDVWSETTSITPARESKEKSHEQFDEAGRGNKCHQDDHLKNLSGTYDAATLRDENDEFYTCTISSDHELDSEDPDLFTASTQVDDNYQVEEENLSSVSKIPEHSQKLEKVTAVKSPIVLNEDKCPEEDDDLGLYEMDTQVDQEDSITLTIPLDRFGSDVDPYMMSTQNDSQVCDTGEKDKTQELERGNTNINDHPVGAQEQENCEKKKSKSASSAALPRRPHFSHEDGVTENNIIEYISSTQIDTARNSKPDKTLLSLSRQKSQNKPIPSEGIFDQISKRHTVLIPGNVISENSPDKSLEMSLHQGQVNQKSVSACHEKDDGTMMSSDEMGFDIPGQGDMEDAKSDKKDVENDYFMPTQVDEWYEEDEEYHCDEPDCRQESFEKVSVTAQNDFKDGFGDKDRNRNKRPEHQESEKFDQSESNRKRTFQLPDKEIAQQNTVASEIESDDTEATQEYNFIKDAGSTDKDKEKNVQKLHPNTIPTTSHLKKSDMARADVPSDSHGTTSLVSRKRQNDKQKILKRMPMKQISSSPKVRKYSEDSQVKSKTNDKTQKDLATSSLYKFARKTKLIEASDISLKRKVYEKVNKNTENHPHSKPSAPQSNRTENLQELPDIPKPRSLNETAKGLSPVKRGIRGITKIKPPPRKRSQESVTRENEQIKKAKMSMTRRIVDGAVSSASGASHRRNERNSNVIGKMRFEHETSTSNKLRTENVQGTSKSESNSSSHLGTKLALSSDGNSVKSPEPQAKTDKVALKTISPHADQLNSRFLSAREKSPATEVLPERLKERPDRGPVFADNMCPSKASENPVPVSKVSTGILKDKNSLAVPNQTRRCANVTFDISKNTCRLVEPRPEPSPQITQPPMPPRPPPGPNPYRHRNTTGSGGVPPGPSDCFKPFRTETEFISSLVSWTPKWLQEQDKCDKPPPILGNNHMVSQLRTSYDDIATYQKISFELFLLEIWATIHTEWKKRAKTRKIPALICSRPQHRNKEEESLGLLSFEMKVIVGPSERHLVPSISDLIILDMDGSWVKEPQKKRTSQQFAYVREVLPRKSNLENHGSFDPKMKGEWDRNYGSFDPKMNGKGVGGGDRNYGSFDPKMKGEGDRNYGSFDPKMKGEGGTNYGSFDPKMKGEGGTDEQTISNSSPRLVDLDLDLDFNDGPEYSRQLSLTKRLVSLMTSKTVIPAF